MKRFVKLLLPLLLMLAMLVSCGGNGGKVTTPSPTTTPAATPTPATTTPAVTMPEDPENAFIGFPYLKTDLSEYASLSASAYAALTVMMDITDEDVDEYIGKVLAANPIEVTSTDRAVKEGDEIYLYYEGSVDGQTFSGGSNMPPDAEPRLLKIGSGTFIPGFEEALVGMIPADTAAQETYIDVTFPEKYHIADLAGKAAKFRVIIVSVFEGYEARTELTAELLLELGYTTEETDAVAAFRAEALGWLREDVVANYDTARFNNIIQELLPSLTVIKLPEQELARLRQMYVDEIEYNFDYYNYLSNMYNGTDYYRSIDEAAREYLGVAVNEDWSVALDELVAEQVKETMILYLIAANEGMTVTDEEFLQTLSEIAEMYDMEDAEVISLAGADYVYNWIIRERVTELLFERTAFDNGGLIFPETE